MLNAWKSLPFPKWLLPLAPVTLVLHFGHLGDPMVHFVVSALAILGLVVVIGAATEEVAMRLGSVWGGLLNASFGNVTELIIALVALKHGSYEVLRASLTGSILGNLLLLMGLAMVAGGIRHKTQTFSRTGASTAVQMLALAVFALVIPSVDVYFHNLFPNLPDSEVQPLAEKLSLGVSILLLVTYGLHLVFSLWTHDFSFRSEEGPYEEPRWSLGTAIAVLVVSVVVVAMCSETFVAAIDLAHQTGVLPMNEMFVGVVVVAVVGNAAEGSVAIIAAWKNKMDLALQVAMSSALQIALLVAPLLVVASFLLTDHPLTLAFSPFELLALGAGVLIAGYTLQDGESNWFEGAMMVAVYAAFALAFWYHP